MTNTMVLERSGGESKVAKNFNYFEGQSRMPYQLRKRLHNSMDGNEAVLDGVCKQCNPAFGRAFVN